MLALLSPKRVKKDSIFTKDAKIRSAGRSRRGKPRSARGACFIVLRGGGCGARHPGRGARERGAALGPGPSPSCRANVFRSGANVTHTPIYIAPGQPRDQ